MLIVGLVGFSGSGKDYVCEQLIEQFPEHRFHRYALADFLKELMCIILECDIDILNKKKVDHAFRQRLIDFSEKGIKKVDHEFWVKKFWIDAMSKKRNYIITDIRYQEELIFLTKKSQQEEFVNFKSVYIKAPTQFIYPDCGLQVAPFQCNFVFENFENDFDRELQSLLFLIKREIK
jgi:hypothetical protein